jgi:hypothetical protein
MADVVVIGVLLRPPLAEGVAATPFRIELS